VNRKNLAVVKAASRDTSRYTINGVYFDKEGSVATNGRMLAVVTNPDSVPSHLEKGIIVPLKLAEELWSMTRYASEVDILEAEASGGMYDAVIARKDNQLSITFKPVDGKYPDWKQVISKNEPVVKVAINPRYMMDMCRIVLDFQGEKENNPSMVIGVHSYPDPIEIHARCVDTKQTFTGILMPIRDDEVSEWSRNRDFS
jgi:DNA polymerase III sliding clamp (beta) subunit (PCNA family)